MPRRGAWAARAAVESDLPDIQHRAGERREGKGGGLSLRFRLGLPKRQEFSMLLQGDKVVKQVCGGSENNGKCSHQKLPRTAGRGRRGERLWPDDVDLSGPCAMCLEAAPLPSGGLRTLLALQVKNRSFRSSHYCPPLSLALLKITKKQKARSLNEIGIWFEIGLACVYRHMSIIYICISTYV